MQLNKNKTKCFVHKTHPEKVMGKFYGDTWGKKVKCKVQSGSNFLPPGDPIRVNELHISK